MLRRSFLQSMLALGMAPSIVRASSLMPVRVPTQWMRLALPLAGMQPTLTESVIRENLRRVFYYTGSFELLIPQIAVINRVWADGKEVQLKKPVVGVAGDRIHFNDFDLAPYGNRIPNFEIEVEVENGAWRSP